VFQELYADDCDAAVERLRAHGVAVLAEPPTSPGASGWPRSPTPTATG
jgi:hypothetical protein